MPANNPADPGSTGDPKNPDPNNPDPSKKEDPPKKEDPADPLANLKAEDKDLIAKLVEDKVKESIKDIKTKLDSAYTSRDDALKKLEEIDKKKRKEELDALSAAGKHKEAFDLQLAEVTDKYTKLELENTELKSKLTEATRDSEVKEKLKEYKFRSVKASNMAFKEISDQLVRNDKGEWVHRTGVKLNDFVATFAKDEANAFLFEPEVNTGLGNNRPGVNGGGTPKSLFKMSQADVMKMAAEGKLPTRK
jgi:hypothetical protein